MAEPANRHADNGRVRDSVLNASGQAGAEPTIGQEHSTAPGAAEGSVGKFDMRRLLVSGPPRGLLVAVAVLLLLVPLGPVLAPYSASRQDIANRLQGPSMSHLLGTDELGRDLLSRLLSGVRVELGVAIPAVLMALVIGSVIGIAAGYVGGIVDDISVLAMDTLQSFPAVILALLLLSLLGPSLRNVIVVIAIAYAPTFGRVTRALVASTREREFVLAERSLGASHSRVILRHIWPNVTAPLVILVALNVPSAIAIEVGLSFLGLGVPPPTPSWGAMLDEGFKYMRSSPWGALSAMAAVMITTLTLASFGDSLRTISDPRGTKMLKQQP